MSTVEHSVYILLQTSSNINPFVQKFQNLKQKKLIFMIWKPSGPHLLTLGPDPAWRGCFAAALLTSSPLCHQSGVPGAQGQPQVANKIVAWTGVLEWQEVKPMHALNCHWPLAGQHMLARRATQMSSPPAEWLAMASLKLYLFASEC